MRKNRTKRRRTRRRRRMRGGAWYNPMTWGQTTNPAGGEAEGGWFSGLFGKKKKAVDPAAGMVQPEVEEPESPSTPELKPDDMPNDIPPSTEEEKPELVGGKRRRRKKRKTKKKRGGGCGCAAPLVGGRRKKRRRTRKKKKTKRRRRR